MDTKDVNPEEINVQKTSLSTRFENLKTALKSKSISTILPILLLAIALPVTVFVAMQRQNFRNFAANNAESLLTSVEVNPGSIDTNINTKSVALSALAYDVAQNPLYDGVTYEWSMSSVSSTGTLTNTNGNITEFLPQTPGYAALTAIARAGNTSVQKSISVVVRNADGSLPPAPTLTPTETSTPTPTFEPPTPTPTIILPTITQVNTPTVTPIPQPKQASFVPTADAYVKSDLPNKNFGKENKLKVLGNPQTISYLSFKLSSLKGKAITKAILRVKIADLADAFSSTIENLKSVTGTWSEDKITYAKRPTLGYIFANFIGNQRATYYDIDVTSWVNTNLGKTASLGIDSSGSNGVILNSKEATTGKPTLIVTYQ